MHDLNTSVPDVSTLDTHTLDSAPQDIARVVEGQTVIEEQGDGIISLGSVARLLSPDDLASEWDLPTANPFLRYFTADFVESDRANSNTQFWTKDDLASSEHTIQYVPVNMLHRRRQPVGVVLNTRAVPRDGDTDDDADDKPIKIQVLGAVWSHVFPMETQLMEAAEELESLFVSMECRGKKLHCAGDKGCGQTFDYMAVDDHCEHLQKRTSLRHIVNPVFRGCGIIIPPTRPGWTEARAETLDPKDDDDDADSTAEDAEVAAWNQLMSMIHGLAETEMARTPA